MRLQVQQYCFVGSAGAYAADDVEPMHVEGDKRKGSASHKEVEDYLERVNAPFTVFHPLYMYGKHTAKDCEQWYLDRILRDRPVPIPTPGGLCPRSHSSVLPCLFAFPLLPSVALLSNALRAVLLLESLRPAAAQQSRVCIDVARVEVDSLCWS
jgi:hypothetical protein